MFQLTSFTLEQYRYKEFVSGATKLLIHQKFSILILNIKKVLLKVSSLNESNNTQFKFNQNFNTALNMTKKNSASGAL